MSFPPSFRFPGVSMNPPGWQRRRPAGAAPDRPCRRRKGETRVLAEPRWFTEGHRRGKELHAGQRHSPLFLVGLEVEVEPGAVLELQGALTAVRPAAHDDVGRQEA